MNTIGNVLWIVLGGWLLFLTYCFMGLFFCLSIIGIPFGLQLFKLGVYALSPFGKEVVYQGESGCLSLTFNILWIVLGWWEIALVHLTLAILCAITIVGLPFAKQHIKLIQISLFPFGAKFV